MSIDLFAQEPENSIMESVKLYSYYRSSASYRVRVLLNYKSIPFEYIPVHLVKSNGEQNSYEYRQLNPMGEVPCLVHGDKVLSQSVAIFNYVEEVFPQHPVFPKDAFKRAKNIEFCEHINSGIHPVQNLKVLRKLEREFQADEDTKMKWAAYWIIRGFQSIENILRDTAGKFSFGDTLSAADMFLTPQVYNAHKYKVDMSLFPIIEKIEKNCLDLDCFRNAYPGVQPDTPNE
jgi:maleylacetoacetate isomerase